MGERKKGSKDTGAEAFKVGTSGKRSKRKLGLLDFSTYTPDMLANIGVGGQEFLVFVVLPVYLVRTSLLAFLKQNPDAARYWPEILDEEGRVCPAKFDESVARSFGRNLEEAVQERAKGNTAEARRLLIYARPADVFPQLGPPDEQIKYCEELLRPVLRRLGNLGMDYADALQTAHQCLLEELQPLRQSREKFYEAILTGKCKYAIHNVRNRLIDQLREATAKKRNPGRRELSLESHDEGLSADRVTEPFSPAPTIEQVLQEQDSLREALKLVEQHFPGEPRKPQIIRLRLEDPATSSAEIADLLGCSKKTVDRDSAQLRKCQPLRQLLNSLWRR